MRQLGPYLNEANVEGILAEAKGKTRIQLDEMIARRFPRPDAPTVEIPLAACPARIEPLSAAVSSCR